MNVLLQKAALATESRTALVMKTWKKNKIFSIAVKERSSAAKRMRSA